VTNNNFVCIQHADKECFKTPPKQSLAYRRQHNAIVTVY